MKKAIDNLPGHFAVIAAIASAFATLAAPASAGDLAYADEVDSCLAAVNERVILGDSNRVRHLVTDSKRTAIGYALTIETWVFSNAIEQRYAVRCLARGRSEPVKLKIDRIDT
jgi:hypothetical protein